MQLKKLTKVGGSIALFLPSSWVKLQEKRLHCVLEEVLVNENVNSLVIMPTTSKIKTKEITSR